MNKVRLCAWCDADTERHECKNLFARFSARAGNHIKHIILRKCELDITNGASDSVFMIRQGALLVDIHYPEGHFTHIFYPGDIFSSYSASPGHTRAHFLAADDTMIWEVSSSKIREFINESPEAVSEFLYAIQTCSRKLCSRYYELALVSLRNRLQHALYEDFFHRGQIYNDSVFVSKVLTHTDWAHILGARRESVSRLFKEFEQSGLIASQDSSISTTDMDRLLIDSCSLPESH